VSTCLASHPPQHQQTRERTTGSNVLQQTLSISQRCRIRADTLLLHVCRYKEGLDDAAEAAVGEAAAGAADEDKLGEDQQKEFTKVDKRVRTTGGGATGSVRNLRIREDTAKYLLNLDPKSAHYDPKSRSMRADPTPDKAPEEKTFAGDNALRTSGDEFEFWQRVTAHTVAEGEKGSAAHLQARTARSPLRAGLCVLVARLPRCSSVGIDMVLWICTWQFLSLCPTSCVVALQCKARSSKLTFPFRMQAAPTQAVMAHEAFKAKKAKLAAKTADAVLAKYGDASAAQPDADLLLPASEAYAEYDRTCAFQFPQPHTGEARDAAALFNELLLHVDATVHQHAFACMPCTRAAKRVTAARWHPLLC
jgi:Pre-mRNA splicing Prp18-interacting factor